jgi:integrase
MRQFKEALVKLPRNRAKDPRYRDKPIAELLATSIPDEARLDVKTVNKLLARISTLLEWGVQNHYLQRNFAKGLSLRKNKRDDEEREAFTDAEVLKLIGAVSAAPADKLSKPYMRWVPLIGAYSGMRLEEICQLQLADIVEVGGIPVFNVSDADGKRLKTAQSRRTVPMHNELVHLGLLEYVRELRGKGQTRLFPELSKGRDGYSQVVSKWFRRWRKRVGLGKPFHSLRHTVSTKLREADVLMDLVSDIVGHARSDNETGRYAKEASVQRKAEALAKLRYGNEGTKP